MFLRLKIGILHNFIFDSSTISFFYLKLKLIRIIAFRKVSLLPNFNLERSAMIVMEKALHSIQLAFQRSQTFIFRTAQESKVTFLALRLTGGFESLNQDLLANYLFLSFLLFLAFLFWLEPLIGYQLQPSIFPMLFYGQTHL